MVPMNLIISILNTLWQFMSSQLNSKRHLLDNLASLYMLRCDLQKFKPILQSNVNILALKLVAWVLFQFYFLDQWWPLNIFAILSRKSKHKSCSRMLRPPEQCN